MKLLIFRRITGFLFFISIPLYNAYRFLVQEVGRFETSSSNGVGFVPDKEIVSISENFTDQWILASARSMVNGVRSSLDKYELFAVAPKLLGFLENLTNWYIRMNRDRMRGNLGHESAKISLNVLYDVVLDLIIVMAPITPFITEHIYTNLKRVLPVNDSRLAESVHFVMMPDMTRDENTSKIISVVSIMQQVILLGRKIRETRGVNLKTPVQSITVISSDYEILNDMKNLEQYICDELNALEVITSCDVTGIETIIKPNFAALKNRFGDFEDFGKIILLGSFSICP